MTDVKELIERLNEWAEGCLREAASTEAAHGEWPGLVDVARKESAILRQAASALQSLVDRNEKMEEALTAVIRLDDLLEKRRDRSKPANQMILDDDSIANGEAVEKFFALLDAVHYCGNAARSALPPEEQS